MLGQLAYSSLGLEQLPNLILYTFNTCASSFNVTCFVWCHFPLDTVILVITSFLIYVICLRVSLALYPDALAWWTMSTFPRLGNTSTTPLIYVYLELISSIVTYHLFAALLSGNIWTLGNNEATQLQALLSTQELSGRSIVTNH